MRQILAVGVGKFTGVKGENPIEEVSGERLIDFGDWISYPSTQKPRLKLKRAPCEGFSEYFKDQKSAGSEAKSSRVALKG